MKYFLIIIIFISFHISKQDLPVHCLSSDIEGDWIIHMGDNNSDSDLKCGHNTPDHNLDHYDIEVEENFVIKYEIILHLERPNTVYSIINESNKIGKWTMIYDEGFEFTVNNNVFFAFSRYKKIGKFNPSNSDTEDTPGYKNICDKTFIGWYHDKDNKNWGCYWAEKIKKDNYNFSELDYEDIFKLNKINKIFKKNDAFQKLNKPNDIIDLFLSISGNSEKKINSELTKETNSYLDFIRSLNWDKINFNNIPHLDIYFLSNKSSNNNFLEIDTSTKLFTPDKNYVNRVNNPKNGYTWTAKIYNDFIGKSYSHMRTLLGNNNYMKNLPNSLQSDFLELSVEISSNLEQKNKYYSELPNSFDWRFIDGTSYDSPVRKQGECGSCYAIAAAGVMEMRIRIKSNNRLKPIISPGSIVSCSTLNQGCSGGYPYLVGKFGKEIGFVEESCQPYTESDEKCFNMCFHQKTWKVKEYGYVGGYYGGCDEQSMMREIYDNGPIIVAINATPEMYYYSSGIFHSEVKKTEGKLEKNVNPWEYTNHAVVCMGWGEEMINDNLVKYWILKNSWGDNWGERGYFRLERGNDMASVEAQAVYITPDLE